MPAQALDAARDTVGGAADAAAERSETVGADLLATARYACTAGFHTAPAVSAVPALATAAVVAVLLRHIPAIGSEGSAAAAAPDEHCPAPGARRPAPGARRLAPGARWGLRDRPSEGGRRLRSLLAGAAATNVGAVDARADRAVEVGAEPR